MAHIATCMAPTEPGSISKSASPTPTMFSSSSPPKNAGRSFAALKAAQADQPQRYQLFPKDKPLPVPNAPNTSKALPTPQPADAIPRSSTLAGIRIRLNQNNLVRRRKVSVPELGPMTTVQETSMDSPTIPGRPPLHERSFSAPDECRLDTHMDRLRSANMQTTDLARAFEDAFVLSSSKSTAPSPKKLAPLVIPLTNTPTPKLQSKHSNGQMRSGSTPPTGQSRSGRLEPSTPSLGRLTPSSTPDLPIPRSATATDGTAPTLQTPMSGTPMSGTPIAQRASPNLWDGPSASGEESIRSGDARGHRREASESSSITDRGRPRKRSESSKPSKSADAIHTKSSERRAFDELPTGWKPCEAIGKLNANDVMALHRQALGQAERFEVLRVEDVDALSKELRQLDDRTEYLRRTSSSLRAGRRNLHSRICQYLRSPRVAKFSHESMLKQEEALAELDASIDDWLTKLEQAENRRTRVRQKLLEHVAAAAILPVPDGSVQMSPFHTQGAPNPGVRDVSTPPRSPTKLWPVSPRTCSSSPSPQRVVAQVPSTILEQPIIEEQTAAVSREISASASTPTTTAKGRTAVESIRVYAGDELYALLADVEDEITRLSVNQDEMVPPPQEPNRLQARKQSQERLNGEALPSVADVVIAPPLPARAPKKDLAQTVPVLLTNAVFKR